MRERLREWFRRSVGRVAGRVDRFMAGLDDPDLVLEYVRRGVGVTIGLAIASAAVSFGLFYVLAGETLEVFIAAFLFWAGYLFAHYEATGLLIHQGGDGGAFPLDDREKLFTGIGAILLLVGATGLPLAASRGDILATNLAVFLAGLGYITAHYGLTGEAL